METSANPLILAIDLGKYKSVACVYTPASAGARAVERLVAIDTSAENLSRLIRREAPAVVVIEACALAGWVHDLCAELGVPCRVANTAGEAWKFKHSRRKTDRDDARRLAQLQTLGELPTVTIPAKPTRQWRALIGGRQALVCRRVALQNRVRGILLGQGLPAPRGHRAWTAAGLAGLAQLARALAECGADDLWRGLLHSTLAELGQVTALLAEMEAKLDALGQASAAVRLVETIPGVGPRTAEAVVAHLGEARRFANGRQVSAYAGLVPRQFQSGEVDRRGRITKRGPAVLRKLLVECAWCSLRYNPWAKAVYARLTRGGTSRKKPAIVALARKLLVRCWAMLRDGTAWRSEPPPRAGCAAA